LFVWFRGSLFGRRQRNDPRNHSKQHGAEPVDGDNRQARRFRLEGERITGAMLTGTKVYEDGATEKFEGVLINRTDFDSPTDKGVSAFGHRVVGNPVEFADVTFG